MKKTFEERERQRTPLSSGKLRIVLTLIIAIVVGIFLVSSSLNLTSWAQLHLNPQEVAQTTVINGANQWDGDETTTAPEATFSPSPTQIAVSALFKPYYQRHANGLGEPVTDAFPIDQGWIQFFASGALLLPGANTRPPATSAQLHSRDGEDPLRKLVASGTKDLATGIVVLVPLQTLLTLGSQAPIGGAGGSITYVDLRKATAPDLMRPAPEKLQSIPAIENQSVFVKGGTRAGKAVGHFIPLPFWNYIKQADVSPDGWQNDMGAPLTEALPFTITTNGHRQHMLVQAFAHSALMLDQDMFNTSGRFTVQPLATGVDYLRTVGLPTIAVLAQQPVWSPGAAIVLAAPDSAQVMIAHLGQHFPLTLLGDTSWVNGTLWYHVQWSLPKSSPSGWVAASAITFTSPGNVPAQAALDALSPQLAAYLAASGPNAGMVLYDVTHQRYYTYNSTTQFLVASSIKVPIMLALFTMTERQGRELNDDEMNLLNTMIENSNNDSASALYSEIGGAAGMMSFMQSVGVSGLSPEDVTWGYSVITPQAMVNLLTLLHEGKVLTSTDRATALQLMENIESDQRVGVGDTAPAGFTVAMKDGWVPGPDGLWAMNTSGIVTAGNETYIISVYTQEQPSLASGQGIVTTACRTVASLLA
jgi:beta-lactamase class A